MGNGTADYALNHYVTRFSDLLLMHSEAENEANGPSQNAVYGINRVRARAGLPALEAFGIYEGWEAISKKDCGNFAKKVTYGSI